MARFDLAEVRALVEARKVRWSVTRAIDPLREEFAAAWKSHGMKILSRLGPPAFHATVNQNGMDFDVYAVRYNDIGWYVKLSIDNVIDARGRADERLFTISCHPLEKPLRTQDGEVQP